VPAPCRRLRAPLLLSLIALAGCGSVAAETANLPRAQSVPPSPSSHVVTIVMENKEADQVLGPNGMPYLKQLARRYGVATSSYAVSHPSLPNYLALTGGSTFGINSDCTSCSVAGPSIVDQLEAAHIGWRAYMEGLPHACFLGDSSSGGYAKKHDPFAYFDRITHDPARCRNIVPLSSLSSDLRNGRLPPYAFISPGLCHDTHDCPLAQGDSFLAGLVPPVLRALGPLGFLVITWDEGTSAAGCCRTAHGGHIATVVAGPDVRRGARSTTPVDHYGVLRTIQRALGLGPLGASGDSVHGSLDALFNRPPQVR
jgi:hypothetical protein